MKFGAGNLSRRSIDAWKNSKRYNLDGYLARRRKGVA